MICIIIGFFLTNCSNQEQKTTKPQASKSQNNNSNLSGQVSDKLKSNDEMARMLKTINANLSPQQSSYKNLGRAQMAMQAARNAPQAQKLNLKNLAANEFLLAGKTKEAIKIYQELMTAMSSLNIPNKAAAMNTMKSFLALAYFRLGEQENCIDNHQAGSCILPLDQNALYVNKESSRQAITYLTELINSNPKDLNSKWLLNVAHMNLGQYSNGMNKKYKVPLAAKENKKMFPKFSNVSSSLGLDDNRLSGGVVVDDFNDDGFLDIIVSSWDLNHSVYYYENDGKGSFINKYKEAGLAGITGGLNLNHCDYNNDGHLDFFIMRGAWLEPGDHPNSLMRNNGDGTFTDVTIASGLFSKHPTQSSAWADFNQDGYLDLVIANETKGNLQHPCELFLNQKNGTFIDVASKVNANQVGFFKG
ncbi:MAG: hypothetical protein HKN51_14345, partial [Saprospiraceae bacterium]|nr:hypothetical protein [Saprospiraceae bacterium]